MITPTPPIPTPRSWPPSCGRRCRWPNFRGSFRGRGGFTLIELTACLVLLGLLTGLAAISLRGLGQAAGRQDVIERLILWDRLAREQARRLDHPVQLSFEIQGQTIQRAVSTSADALPERAGRWTLPPGHRLHNVRVEGSDESFGEDVAVVMSRRGHSPTYAIQIVSGEGGGGGEGGWLVIAGLSGQAITVETREQVDAIFEALQARR